MAFVIKEHRPGRRQLYILLLIIAWALSGLLLYIYGWQQANTAYDEALEKQQALAAEIKELAKANRDMQVQVSVLGRSAQVDREAKAGIAREMKALQDMVSELREEASFYKGIVSPEAGKTGLNIYRFTATVADDDLYHYKLILTQAGKNDRLVSGEAKVTFEGVLDNKEKVLNLSDIQVSKSGELSYQFRFFQELNGSFRLPDNYYPRTVIIKLQPKGRGKTDKPVRNFDWSPVRDGEN